MKKLFLILMAAITAISVYLIAPEAKAAGKEEAMKVVDIANSKVGSSYAKGMCLAFVREMHQKAYGYRSTSCCAYNYGSSYIVSKSRDNIPLGADIYFAGSKTTCSTCGRKCGHVGVYVGGGMVVHAWSGRIEKYSIDQIETKGYPYRGWGWHGGRELTVPATLAKIDGVWKYMVGGEHDTSYTGLVKFSSKWYYVENGVLNWHSAPTLTKYNGGWYYTENGMLNWNYTGIVQYNSGWYYVENGCLNWHSAPTLCRYNANWYYTACGEVDWGYSGLIHFSRSWYNIENGRLNWHSAPKLVYHNYAWYYTENGMLNWRYSGPAYLNGVLVQVNQGKAVIP